MEVFMNLNNQIPDFENIFKRVPQARAEIKGSVLYPSIEGDVWFYQAIHGVLVVLDIKGLPNDNIKCAKNIFALHIHEGSNCSGNIQDPFADAGVHYNPNNCLHPSHAGGLPPLFGVDGFAFLTVLTNRFTIDEIVGKAIVIHSSFDDFSTQPAGNSGTKIACGEIRLYK